MIILILLLIPLLIFVALQIAKKMLYFHPIREHLWNGGGGDENSGGKFTSFTHHGLDCRLYTSTDDSRDKKVILFVHGNGGNISHRHEQMTRLMNLGMSVLIFDYSGFGYSTGKPSEHQMYRDTETMWDFLCHDYSSSDIIVYGESIGCAVAAHLCTVRPVKKVILQSGFNSMAQMAQHLIGGPLILWNILCPEFKTHKFLKIARKRGTRIMLMHSPTDEVVPYTDEMSYLADKTHKIEGGHNTTVMDDLYLDAIKTFNDKIYADSEL